eukprot:GFKZ01012054.1.p1 GENE.GFKZ01012054.1~~GFKZ01012054.1.p1  ORF type:complete len:346 (-),score=53.18 GFKZ01012054.1:885-1922(-)
MAISKARSLVPYGVIFVALSILPTICDTQGAPALSTASANAQPSCDSSDPESAVLREASERQEACIAQIVSEEEASESDQGVVKPSADDVWSAAYNQWIKNQGAARRALDEVNKRYGKVNENDSKSKSSDEVVLDDDEAAKITFFVRMLAESDISVKNRLDVLEEIDLLCASGDNGRQLAAVGGVSTLIGLGVHPVLTVATGAIRTLASCAQNNPDVYDAAVKENAVERLIDTALESGHETGLRAATLRALVAIADGEKAGSRLWARRLDVGRIVRQAVGGESRGTEARRCLLRALALAERCLSSNGDWVDRFRADGLAEAAEIVLESEDVDVREGAARVLKALR